MVFVIIDGLDGIRILILLVKVLVHPVAGFLFGLGCDAAHCSLAYSAIAAARLVKAVVGAHSFGRSRRHYVWSGHLLQFSVPYPREVSTVSNVVAPGAASGTPSEHAYRQRRVLSKRYKLTASSSGLSTTQLCALVSEIVEVGSSSISLVLL